MYLPCHDNQHQNLSKPCPTSKVQSDIVILAKAQQLLENRGLKSVHICRLHSVLRDGFTKRNWNGISTTLVIFVAKLARSDLQAPEKFTLVPCCENSPAFWCEKNTHIRSGLKLKHKPVLNNCRGATSGSLHIRCSEVIPI